MAKWGEGDPRWIVEERPDATNVNNWHWTEKNASNWSKDKLTQLLLNLSIDEPGIGVCTIDEVKSIEGEAVANNRKGKLIFFYEWVIKMSWTGRVNGSDESEAKGELQIPNLSEENTADEITVEVSLTSDNVTGEILKQVMRNRGIKLIRDQIAKYITGLRDEFAKDMIKPTKLTPGGSINSFQTESQVKDSSKQTLGKEKTSSINGAINKVSDGKMETTDLKITESMKCTAEELYRALTDLELVRAFSQNCSVLEPTVDGKFSLFDGNVSGTFTYLEPNKCIKQNWRFKGWPEGHYSQVTINLEQKEDCTQVTLTQTSIPVTDLERTEAGWRRNYFESMKRVLGFGAMLQ